MDEKQQKNRIWVSGIVLILLLVFIDQLTKVLAVRYLSDRAPVELIFNVRLTITYNPGMSYGMGASASKWAKIAVIVITGIVMTGLTVLYFKTDEKSKLLRLAYLFIVGGGVGNLIDRIYYRVWNISSSTQAVLNRQGVRDMVDLSDFIINFAVCNFADFFVSAGGVMLVLAVLFFDKSALYPLGKYKALAEAEKSKEQDEA